MSAGKVAVDQFVRSYTDDPSAICFAWNGKHAEQFEDANAVFRDAVVDCVIAEPEQVPLSLLVDLYHALTGYSVEAWGIDERVETIGRLMLVKGRKSVAHDYIKGARQSFDAHCATVFAGCPADVARECLEFSQARLDSATDNDEQDRWQTAVERFGVLLKHAEDGE